MVGARDRALHFNVHFGEGRRRGGHESERVAGACVDGLRPAVRPASSGVEGTACPELVLSSFVLNVNHTLAVPNKKEHTSSAGISHTPVVLLPMLRACMWEAIERASGESY